MISLFGTTPAPPSLQAPAAQPQPAGAFPLKAALALATASALLIAAHFLFGGTRGLSPGIVRQAATLHVPHPPAPAPLPDPNLPFNGVQGTVADASTTTPAVAAPAEGNSLPQRKPKQTSPEAQAQAQTPNGPTWIDDSGALDAFYARLWTLQQHTQPLVVTVLHYGDSPTTADLITGDVRALLQERFGDAGHGYNLGAKPWAWYGHRDVDIRDKGWASSQKDATPVGRMKQGAYGIGGAIFAGSAGAQTTYTLHGAPQTAVLVDYLGGTGDGALAISAGDTVLATFDTAGAGPMQRLVPLLDGTTAVKVAVTRGTVRLFGVDFRRGANGILYDSLGLNGATTTVLSRTFDPALWATEMQNARPSLIVINYGTNESQFSGLVDTLDKELRLAIAKARTAAPGVPILVMSPMDRGEGSATSGIHTNPLIPKIVAIQQRVAADTHCAFFNTYAAMGADGTMARWYAAKPRLVTADLIHPTPQGAEYVAQLMVGALYGGYDHWKTSHGIGVIAVMNPVQAAAKRKEDTRLKKEANAKATSTARRPKEKPQPQP